MQHAAALTPVISGLQEEITGLRRELDQQRLQAAVAQQELEGMASRLAEVCMCVPQTCRVYHMVLHCPRVYSEHTAVVSPNTLHMS